MQTRNQLLDERLKRGLNPAAEDLGGKMAIARSALQKMGSDPAKNDTAPRRNVLTNLLNELLDKTAWGAGRSSPDLLRLAGSSLSANNASSGFAVQEVASLVLLANQLQDLSGNGLDAEERANLLELSEALLHSGVVDTLSPTMRRQLVFSWLSQYTPSFHDGDSDNVRAVEENVIRHSKHLSYPEEKVQLLAMIPDDLLLEFPLPSRSNLVQALLGELSMDERALFESQYVNHERPGLSEIFHALSN